MSIQPVSIYNSSLDLEARHIVPLSGGKDSTAMSIYLTRNYPEIDFEFVFSDTGAELPETYNYFERLEHVLGKKVTRITALDTPRTPLGQFSTLAPALSALASLNADAEDRARIAVALIRYDNAMCPDPADDAEIDYCSGVPLLHSDIETLLFAHEI